LWYPPVVRNDDINTPEFLKLRARLSAILNRRHHRSLTSVMAAAIIAGFAAGQTPATADQRG
jgi:hypothetical protein